MKTKKLVLFLLSALLLAGLVGCSMSDSASEPSDVGYYKIAVNNQQGSPSSVVSLLRKTAQYYNSVSKAVITVEDANGKLISSDQVIELFNFTGIYMSERIQLPEGTYYLTRFFVADSNNFVKYAIPMDGSSLAASVSDTLPIEFTIANGTEYQVLPQVLEVGNQTAADFGYSEDFEIPDSDKPLFP